MSVKVLVPSSVASLAAMSNFKESILSASFVDVEDELEKNKRVDFHDLTIFLKDFDFLLNSHNIRFNLDKTLLEVAENEGEAKANAVISIRKLGNWCKNKNHLSYLRHAAELLEYDRKLPPKVEISDFVNQNDSSDIIKLGMQLMYTDGLMSELRTFVKYLAYRYLLNQDIDSISNNEHLEMCKALNEIKYKNKIKKILDIVDKYVNGSGTKNKKKNTKD